MGIIWIIFSKVLKQIQEEFLGVSEAKKPTRNNRRAAAGKKTQEFQVSTTPVAKTAGFFMNRERLASGSKWNFLRPCSSPLRRKHFFVVALVLLLLALTVFMAVKAWRRWKPSEAALDECEGACLGS